ncbi:uncharacterized protein CTHT_0040060 [Thermochaetoides thermophila DSM 1495]|uniref:Protein kinase domain-containing protein n=1 Tax=Chaetomium thermophilum (strain DSM 1495 / CBS 144.50 / IMI 039719) TaxID=759272 RepID=G0S8R4_CHATD|nr:hypothetical protein CTHT_0040060 [Thermochaetoides thermophila DSM 1495]EGS20267.1 hypothetical protein CTHT_0040060 [Thermochaetoides thermophila DSM 1495]
MESYTRGVPFQRRLSRLYNDTKRKSDFLTQEPAPHADSDPEIQALHRKLRIQKDRLVTWGLEWSDPNQAASASAEVLIDSSLSKAGLSEVVGSIMTTIRDILAEAEQLWNKRHEQVSGGTQRKGEKIRMVVWDRNKFEDLIRDLTTSIDTLYDLSRTRSSFAVSSAAARARLEKPLPSLEEMRPFESTRIKTPQVIDPKTLTPLRLIQAEPMTEPVEHGERVREIVIMKRDAFAELMRKIGSTSAQAHAPLLLEYAYFDDIYTKTGIPPPMNRFEKISAALQAEPQRAPGSWTGLPRMLGYFEDLDSSRFGLVYQFPRTFHAVTFEHLTQHPLNNMCTLADLLARPDFEPRLEAKFRLAANLANTLFDLHDRGVTHCALVTENISFCNAVGTDPEVSGITQGEVDIRRPLLSGFDLFWDPHAPGEEAGEEYSLYRHPLDPRNSAASPLAEKAGSKIFDLYSLAMVLLSVGLWTKLENLVTHPQSPVSEALLDQLAIRCGTLYMKAVQTCWRAVDQELMGAAGSTEEIVRKAQARASRYLEACCILDGVNALEERLGAELGEERMPVESESVPAADVSSSKAAKEKEREAMWERAARGGEAQVQKSKLPSTIRYNQLDANPSVSDPTPVTPKPKLRLYPHVTLPPDVVDHWNKVLMPQINSALRTFYRKHPESVEISLESIGESPQKTRPTVLVVCTSVSKVKAILRKKLGGVFDGESGIGLKVCRGQVVRSRKDVVPTRSMSGSGDGEEDERDNPEEIGAANPDYQEHPTNGASIGAWIGDRHLPPVSLGGLIVVDGKQYGMTVHHMLDDPEQVVRSAAAAAAAAAAATENTPRSMAHEEVQDLAAWYETHCRYQTESEGDNSSVEDAYYACEFSDSESDDISESAITSSYSDPSDGSSEDVPDDEDEDDEESQFSEPGDIPGIEPGCGDGYIITQPALDDMPEGFYPCAETQDEDHLDTCMLGTMYASSGIRRRTDELGFVHEIDWALFKFDERRMMSGNTIPSANFPDEDEEGAEGEGGWISPTSIVPTLLLPGLQVQCMARTSGIQTGVILPTLTSLKIFGRVTPSHTYQIAGVPFSPPSVGKFRSGPGHSIKRSPLPMGVPGDSGAWVISRLPYPDEDNKKEGHALAGHILAFSARKRVAYICPMEVLIRDIGETLCAREIRLPSREDGTAPGEVIWSSKGKRVSVLSTGIRGSGYCYAGELGRRESQRSVSTVGGRTTVTNLSRTASGRSWVTRRASQRSRMSTGYFDEEEEKEKEEEEEEEEYDDKEEGGPGLESKKGG